MNTEVSDTPMWPRPVNEPRFDRHCAVFITSIGGTDLYDITGRDGTTKYIGRVSGPGNCGYDYAGYYTDQEGKRIIGDAAAEFLKAYLKLLQ